MRFIDFLIKFFLRFQRLAIGMFNERNCNPPSDIKILTKWTLDLPLKILLIEDNNDIRENTAEILELANFKVVTAKNGKEGVAAAQKEKPDVLIVGEVHEWETAEYVRDAQSMGSSMSLIVLGHAESEEPGMEWLVPWLQPKVGGIKVSHVASHSPFMEV